VSCRSVVFASPSVFATSTSFLLLLRHQLSLSPAFLLLFFSLDRSGRQPICGWGLFNLNLRLCGVPGNAAHWRKEGGLWFGVRETTPGMFFLDFLPGTLGAGRALLTPLPFVTGEWRRLLLRPLFCRCIHFGIERGRERGRGSAGMESRVTKRCSAANIGISRLWSWHPNRIRAAVLGWAARWLLLRSLACPGVYLLMRDEICAHMCVCAARECVWWTSLEST
jgi:hypothetical protein